MKKAASLTLLILATQTVYSADAETDYAAKASSLAGITSRKVIITKYNEDENDIFEGSIKLEENTVRACVLVPKQHAPSTGIIGVLGSWFSGRGTVERKTDKVFTLNLGGKISEYGTKDNYFFLKPCSEHGLTVQTADEGLQMTPDISKHVVTYDEKKRIFELIVPTQKQ